MVAACLYFAILTPLVQQASRTFEFGNLPLLYALAGLVYGAILGLDGLLAQGKKSGPWRVAAFPLLVKGIPLLFLAVAPYLAWDGPFPMHFLFRMTGGHFFMFTLLIAIALGNTVVSSLHKQG